MDGSVGVGRCDDLEEEEEMHFLCTATGVFVFCVLCLGKGGKYVRRPRERGREGGREFRGMMGGSMSVKGK